MARVPRIWGLHAAPSRSLAIALGLILFLLVIAVYLVAVQHLHAENPSYKILPTPAQMAAAIERMAFTPDRRSGDYLLWADTLASLGRIAAGVSLAAVIGLLLGLNMGVFPGLRAILGPGLNFFAMIPPLAVLPILFIIAGIDEAAKIALICIGIFPIIARDILLAVDQIPRQQMTKALTLGASQFAVAYRILLPQIMPRLIDSVRLALGAAWLFLIAAEAIAATEGLGYRIFLVRRYLAMDVIIPYVLWITLLGFTAEWLLTRLNRWLYPWYAQAGR